MAWGLFLFRWFSVTCAFLFAGALAMGEDDEAERRELHLYLKGRYLFQKQCTTCHGTTGRGNGPWAAELTDKPRNFRTGIFKFRTTPYGKLPVKDDLRRTIRSGISGTAMPFFKDFSDDDVDALIVFLQSLSREWDKEELQSESLPLPEIPSWFGSVEEKKDHAASGAPLFKSTCAVCHGEEGNGDGPGAKGLMDVWEHPITPAALSAEHHKSGDRPADLYRTIATGLNGTPMIGYAETLTEEQIWDLVAFVQSLSESGKKDA
jgi:mono/diheme cytochrome c family protein